MDIIDESFGKKFCKHGACYRKIYLADMCGSHYRKQARLGKIRGSGTEGVKNSGKTYRRSATGKYNLAKKTASDRGLSFDISKNEYASLTSNPCFYCDSKLCPTGSGLDRIDNNMGYLIDNVVPCCGDCNKARGNRYTITEFKVMIRALLDYRAFKSTPIE